MKKIVICGLWMIAVISLSSCGQGQPEKKEVKTIKKIADIGDLSKTGDNADRLVDDKGGEIKLVSGDLLVTLTFPDGWSTSNYDEVTEYGDSSNFKKDIHFNGQIDVWDSDSSDFYGKIEDSMDDKTVETLIKYAKADETHEGDESYKADDPLLWRNSNYETVAFNGQKYLKVTGETVTEKDSGDAKLLYYTIYEGRVIKFYFQAEAAQIDGVTQSSIDGIMNTIQYTKQ